MERRDEQQAARRRIFSRLVRAELHGEVRPDYPERPRLTSAAELFGISEGGVHAELGKTALQPDSIGVDQAAQLLSPRPDLLPPAGSSTANHFHDLPSMPEHIRRRFES